MKLNYFQQYITGYTVANFGRYPIRHRVTKANTLECPFVAYCVTKFKTVFCGVLLRCFLVISQTRPDKTPIKYKCSTV